MATSRRRSADDGRQTLTKIRKSIAKGGITKLFEDSTFVFELIDALYEESLDVTVKTEFLTVLEQYGSDHLENSCAEQVAQRLLDVLQGSRGKSENHRFLTQLMITLTTLLIQNDMLMTEICGSMVTQLWEMVWRVNDVGSRPLRGCACQCLRQLEEWNPGLLSRYKDRLVQAVREERTHVFQDYAMLLSTVLTSLCKPSASMSSSQTETTASADEVVPALSYLMENAFLLTPSGLWLIVLSVMKVVQSTVHVSPSIFKPLMLQNIASLDSCMLHIVLYVQKECQGEILTATEELQLLQRLASQVNLLTCPPAMRLLILQWLKAFLQIQGSDEETLEKQPMTELQQVLRPSVFDSLDIHVDKLNVLTLSYAKEEDHYLLRDIHYLKRLALTTGNEQATVGLYRILFAAYTHHQTQHVSDTVIKITQDLIVDYPHLIPLILDFLLAVKERLSDSHVYLDTLSSLHNQVLNARYAEVLTQYHFFLQVLATSAKQPFIQQHKTLRFLLSLVRYAEDCGLCNWELGCAVLAVCKNLLMHHCTDDIYYELGELLFEMQSCFSDVDIRNRARLFYALLAGACDEKLREVLGTKLQGGLVLTKNITEIITGAAQTDLSKAEIVHLETTALIWQRQSLMPVFSKLETPTSLKIANNENVTERLKGYHRHLAYHGTRLVCHYRLTLGESSEFETITAVTVKFKPSTDAFEHIPDVNMLSLSKLDCKDLEIKLIPKNPQPTVFNVQLLFTSEDHRTISTLLDPVEVTFSDLTLTFPWEELGVGGLQDQHCVFDDMWAYLTADGKGERSPGVESVKVLKECTADKIHSALQPFRLPPCPGEETSTLNKFFLFLPPCYHLLLRVYPVGQNQVVSMATDHWKILPCVNNFLNSLDVPLES